MQSYSLLPDRCRNDTWFYVSGVTKLLIALTVRSTAVNSEISFGAHQSEGKIASTHTRTVRSGRGMRSTRKL